MQHLRSICQRFIVTRWYPMKLLKFTTVLNRPSSYIFRYFLYIWIKHVLTYPVMVKSNLIRIKICNLSQLRLKKVYGHNYSTYKWITASFCWCYCFLQIQFLSGIQSLILSTSGQNCILTVPLIINDHLMILPNYTMLKGTNSPSPLQHYQLPITTLYL